MKFRIVVCLVLINWGLYAQNFIWKRGSTLLNQWSTFGTKGVASPLNDPGGREGSTTWIDNAGNLWLFGGMSKKPTNVLVNDLWKYDVSINQWTWISGDSIVSSNGVYGSQGIANSANKPSARQNGVPWTDTLGNLWMFGGSGYYTGAGPPGTLNDLWKYNIASNQWTWINGSNTGYQSTVYGTMGVPSNSAIPGSRVFAVGWKDSSGNFWLFGSAYPQKNELWKYNPSTNQWAWMKGNTVGNSPGIYGIQGVPNYSNTPGARSSCVSWIDTNDNLWLFGGGGFDAFSNYGSLNDLWKYNISTNEWTWVKGSNLTNQTGIYGSIGISNSTNNPGGRGGLGWMNNTGEMFLFGGEGIDAFGSGGLLNDVWKYSPFTNQWTWLEGSNIVNQNNNYGIQGISSTLNAPSGRSEGACWYTPTSDIVWLFGGANWIFAGKMNDLWQLSNCVAQTITLSTSSSVLCSGHLATLTATGANNYAWNSNLYGSSVVVNPYSATSYSVLSTDVNGCNNSATISLSVIPSPTLTVTTSSATICSGSTVTLNVSGASTYFWGATQSGPSATMSPSASTTYSVIGISTNGCSNIALITQSVSPLPILSLSFSNNLICFGDTIMISVSGANTYSWSNAQNTSIVALSPSTTTAYSVNGVDQNGCENVASITISVTSCTDIDKLKEQSREFFIYPNPNNGEFNVRGGRESDSVQLIIYNFLGQKVFEQKTNNLKSIIKSGLDKGLYNCLIIGKNHKWEKKILIE